MAKEVGFLKFSVQGARKGLGFQDSGFRVQGSGSTGYWAPLGAFFVLGLERRREKVNVWG